MEDLPDIEIGKTSYWSSLSYRLYVALSLPEQLPEEVTTVEHLRELHKTHVVKVQGKTAKLVLVRKRE